MSPEFELALRLLTGKQQILVFTGAGVSTESGIPDFRGPNGVWTKIDPSEFTYDKYVRYPETRKRSWRMRFGVGLLEAGPNAAHHALAEMWNAGILTGCVTQNIDGLHLAGGLPPEAVVEVHGNVHTTRCLDCGRTWPTSEIAVRVDAGDEDPHCEHCGGILKVAVISFGEAMPEAEMARASLMAGMADAVVAVGSTLSVYPAAFIPLEAREQGAPYVIINQGATEHDPIANVKVEAPAGKTLSQLAAALTNA